MTINEHDAHQAKCYAQQIEGIDYVKCGLCTFVGARIMRHVEDHHALKRSLYEAEYGSATAVATRERYSACNKVGGDWINRAKAAGQDITGWKQKMATSVRTAIMSNPDERKRRSELAKMTIGTIARSSEGRKRSSDAAKITSARPEIQKARAGKLRAWRESHQDDFYTKCVANEKRNWKSKPEAQLFAFLSTEFPQFEFKQNQQLMASCFTNKTRRRQIDVMSRSRRIIVEFDGALHFRNIAKWNQLDAVIARDEELNAVAISHGYIVIRIGYDQAAKSSGELTDACKRMIRNVLATATPGSIHKIGEVYE